MFLRFEIQSPVMILFTFAFLSMFIWTTTAANTCQPGTWGTSNDGLRIRAVSTTVSNPTTTEPPRLISSGNVKPGQINCRYQSTTRTAVNYYTCMQLAIRYGITIELFFVLNPTVTRDCGNIKPNTNYCVAGFIEPLRATDGLCGPLHNNATCLGMNHQCCNSETWTCGSSTADCAAGTCYEGACVGDKVYSTDGTCGYKHNNRLCAGKWGNCCNLDGACGTGLAFCSTSICQSGNCTRPIMIPSTPWWLSGNTTDGTCGGVKKTSCNVVWGNCCNKDGFCGSLASDCGVGCQPKWGNCSSISTSLTQIKTSLTTKSSTVTLTVTKTSTPSTSTSKTTATSSKVSIASISASKITSASSKVSTPSTATSKITTTSSKVSTTLNATSKTTTTSSKVSTASNATSKTTTTSSKASTK